MKARSMKERMTRGKGLSSVVSGRALRPALPPARRTGLFLAALMALVTAACDDGGDGTGGGGNGGGGNGGGGNGGGGNGGGGNGGSGNGGGGNGGGATCGGLAGMACADTEYCDFPDDAMCGAADQTGTCKPKPDVCTDDCPGVCGCDGQFYCNACMAAQQGVDESPGADCSN